MAQGLVETAQRGCGPPPPTGGIGARTRHRYSGLLTEALNEALDLAVGRERRRMPSGGPSAYTALGTAIKGDQR